MSNRRGLSIVVGAVTVGLLAAGSLWAQGGAGFGRSERRPLLEFMFENLGRLSQLRRQLHLSPDQKSKLKELIKSRKPEIVQAMGKVRAARKKVQSAVQAEAANDAAIRSAAAGMAEPLAEAALLRSKIRREALAVLTAEQRGKVDKVLAEAQASADEAFEEFKGR
jgi:Spy/CpxP family protein refolding chaperone